MAATDDLEARSASELAQLVRELRGANIQQRNGFNQPPSAAQSLLDDQLRRTSLLTQLAIEFREGISPQTIAEQTLRALTAHLMLAGASILLVAPGGAVELALAASENGFEPLSDAMVGPLIEHGLAGWVLRHGSSVALSDLARDRRWLQVSEQHTSGSMIVLPIRQTAATLGVLTVHRSLPYAFDSHDLILLEGVAAQLGVALSVARHQGIERQRREQAMALLTVSQFLSAEHSSAELATMLHEKSVEIFGVRTGLLYLSDEASGELRPMLWGDEQAPAQQLVGYASGAAQLAWSSQRIATTAPAPELTCVALPLNHHGATLGAFALLHNGGGFSAAIWSLLTVFTHNIAAACASMRLIARLTEQTRVLEELVGQRTQQVRRSRDALRLVFDSLREGVLLLDQQERVLAANTLFCRSIIGTHPREVVARSYAEVWQALERRAPLQVELAPASGVGRQTLSVLLADPAGKRRFLVERVPIGASEQAAEQYLEFWREAQ